MRHNGFLAAAACLGLLAGAESGGFAQATRARITQLGDMSFGQLSGASDVSASDDVCVFSTLGDYVVTASGSGSGGAFALVAPSGSLPFEVMWAGTPGQTVGTALAAGVASPAFATDATQQSCNSGPPATASLIVVIRANAVASARAGSYQGTLSIMITPQ